MRCNIGTNALFSSSLFHTFFGTVRLDVDGLDAALDAADAVDVVGLISMDSYNKSDQNGSNKKTLNKPSDECSALETTFTALRYHRPNVLLPVEHLGT